MAATVLVADDDKFICKAVSQYLTKQGFITSVSCSGAETLARIEQSEQNFVLLDLRMPDTDDLELLTEIRTRWPNVIVIMMTAHGSIELAIDAVKKGAFDFLTKPFAKLEIVLLAIQRASAHSDVVKKLDRAESHIKSQFGFSNMIEHSDSMVGIFRIIKDVAYSSSTVLVLGESGTGKELVAREIHLKSPRKDQEFVTCNCGALTESILESELFGHAKGSFTGAIEDKQGLFDLANNGTLFLDEIGEMPLHTQVKLLRAIQEGEIKRVGDVKSQKINVRIIAATNKNLDDLVKNGKFRQDLYYRINVIRVDLPPLRERKDDIKPLVSHFIEKYNTRLDKVVEDCSIEFFYCLNDHDWPGNVRELENVIERAMVITKNRRLEIDDLPQSLLGRLVKSKNDDLEDGEGSAKHAMTYSYMVSKQRAVEVFTKNYLSKLLHLTGGNITKAAEMAGVHRSNFKKLMRENDIAAEPFKDDGC